MNTEETGMSLKKASMINGISKFGKILIQLLLNAVLARILSPSEYGIVAVITVFATLFNTFSDMGFGAAIIQNKELSKDDIDHIFTFTIYFGLLLSIVFCFFSYPISLFYKNQIYIFLGIMLSFSLFFNTINMIPNAILLREKKFVVVAVRTIVVSLCGGIITVVLALMKFSFYALVIQTILISLASFFWNYFSTKPKFVIRVKKEPLSKVASFSFYQFAFNIINYFSRNLDNLLTGKFLGDVELAYYDKAYTLMLYPVNNLTGIVSPVLHPILSDYQNEKKYLYESYIMLSKIFGMIGVFVAIFCFFASEELIYIFYGSQWERSVLCFKILSLVVVTQMINSCTGSIFQSLGNTKLLFISGTINSGITIFMIIFGLLYGKSIESLAVCVALAYLMHFLTAHFILNKFGFHKNMFSFLNRLKNQILTYVFLLCAVYVYPFRIDNIFISIMAKFMWMSALTVLILIMSKEYKIFLRH